MRIPMFRGKSGLLLVVLLAGLAATLASGCSKYDTLERNMQYVSHDLLRKDGESTWREVNEAHAAWVKAGSSHEKGDAAYVAYQDAYARYAIVYNELWDRQHGGYSFSGHLGSAVDALPPPPPGLAVPPVAPKAAATTPTTSGGDLPGPAGRTLTDPVKPAKSAKPAKPVPEAGLTAPVAPPTKSAKANTAAVVAAGPGSYLVQPGDTLASIAKRHGLSEKRLMDANGITDPRKLAAGKPLTIPAP